MEKKIYKITEKERDDIVSYLREYKRQRKDKRVDELIDVLLMDRPKPKINKG